MPSRSASFATRDQILSPKGWRELDGDFFNIGDTQVALFSNEHLKCSALVFRGTLGLDDTLIDVEFLPVPWAGQGLIHKGFRDQLEDVWKALEDRLTGEVDPVFFTGHSLGAALATLAAALCMQGSSLRAP